MGFGVGGFHVCATYATEIVSCQHRAKACLFIFVANCFGSAFGALLALLTIENFESGWRDYVLWSTSILVIGLVLVVLFCPESPRYLLYSGRKDQALEVVQHLNKDENTETNSLETVEISHRGSFTELFASKSSTRNIMTLSFIYFGFRFLKLVINLIFFEDLQNPKASMCGVFVETYDSYEEKCASFNKQDYIYNLLFSLSYLLAALVSVIMADIFGRKMTLAIVTGLASVSLVAFYFCMPNGLLTFFAIISRGLVNTGIMVISLFINECFPTYLRSVASGFAECFSQIGYTVAPLLAQYVSKLNYPLAVTCFIIISVLCFGLILTVRQETKDIELDTKTPHSKDSAPRKNSAEK